VYIVLQNKSMHMIYTIVHSKKTLCYSDQTFVVLVACISEQLKCAVILLGIC